MMCMKCVSSEENDGLSVLTQYISSILGHHFLGQERKAEQPKKPTCPTTAKFNITTPYILITYKLIENNKKCEHILQRIRRKNEQ